MDHYSQYLPLAEVDASAKYLTEAALTGISIQYDRWKTAHMGTASQGAVAIANRSSKLSGLWGMLSSRHILTAGGGGSSSGGAKARIPGESESLRSGEIVSSFEEAFGPSTATVIGETERRRIAEDPIS